MPAYYLKALRVAKGLTQQELAKLSDLKQNTISVLENVAKPPSSTTLFALAKVLHVAPEDLRFGPEPPPGRRPRLPRLQATTTDPGPAERS